MTKQRNTKKQPKAPICPSQEVSLHPAIQKRPNRAASIITSIPILSLLHIRRRERLDNTRAVHEPRPENAVRVREHAILQTDDDELAAAEARADQAADVLRVREVERGVDFVEDVHWRGGVLEEGEDEGAGEGVVGGQGEVEAGGRQGVWVPAFVEVRGMKESG